METLVLLESRIGLRSRVNHFAGLLLSEWLTRRTLLRWMQLIYLASTPLTVFVTWKLYTHATGALIVPAEIARFTVPYTLNWSYWVAVALALYAGWDLGGGELGSPAEEFLVSLPPTRTQRFLTRLLIAMALLGVHAAVVVGVSRIGEHWNFLNEFSEATGRYQPPYLMAGPLACFALVWILAGTCKTRPGLLLAVGLFALPLLAYLPLFNLNDAYLYPNVDQLVLRGSAILWGWTLWMLFLGYRIYLTREVHALMDH